LSFYFVNDNKITSQGHFGYFNKDTLEIKIFYEDTGRGYGGGGRICSLIHLTE